MSIRYGVTYHTDENINFLTDQIQNQLIKLKPDYLEIERLAYEIIKYSNKGMKYDEKQD